LVVPPLAPGARSGLVEGLFQDHQVAVPEADVLKMPLFRGQISTVCEFWVDSYFGLRDQRLDSTAGSCVVLREKQSQHRKNLFYEAV